MLIRTVSTFSSFLFRHEELKRENEKLRLSVLSYFDVPEQNGLISLAHFQFFLISTFSSRGIPSFCTLSVLSYFDNIVLLYIGGISAFSSFLFRRIRRNEDHSNAFFQFFLISTNTRLQIRRNAPLSVLSYFDLLTLFQTCLHFTFSSFLFRLSVPVIVYKRHVLSVLSYFDQKKENSQYSNQSLSVLSYFDLSHFNQTHFFSTFSSFLFRPCVAFTLRLSLFLHCSLIIVQKLLLKKVVFQLKMRVGLQKSLFSPLSFHWHFNSKINNPYLKVIRGVGVVA